MDLKTSLVYQVAKLRLRRIEQYATRAEELQAEQLRHILSRAARTDFGRRYGLTRKTTYSSYCSDVPIVDYEGLKADIERMTRGERDVLVPGPCQWFAKSSGTTSDRSKYIPVPLSPSAGLPLSWWERCAVDLSEELPRLPLLLDEGACPRGESQPYAPERRQGFLG